MKQKLGLLTMGLFATSSVLALSCGGGGGGNRDGSARRDGRTPLTGTICMDMCGTDNAWVGDGACDDGGPDSDTSVCDFGMDCTDCGSREASDCVPDCSSSTCGGADDGCGGSCPGSNDCGSQECGTSAMGCNCGSCDSTKYCSEASNTCLDRAGTSTCSNDCQYAGDMDCDDGGPNSDFDLCELGSDCEDCGPR